MGGPVVPAAARSQGCARRHQRHRDTARRISASAQRLCEERGLDGFTLEDLAGDVGVSRRTLFNHVPGKLDAVLGPVPDLDEALAATFTGGGPTGDLLEDVIVLARQLAAEGAAVAGATRADLERGHRLMLAEPRLLARARERFDALSATFDDLLLDREGPGFGRERARLLIHIVVATYDVALDRVLADDDVAAETLPDLFAQTIREVRGLFC